MSKTQKILIAVVGICVLVGGFVVGRMGGGDVNATITTTRGVTPIPEDEVLTMSEWEKYYPLEYNSYLKTQEQGEKLGEFGGNFLYQHSIKQPELLTNFKGFGFGKDYSDDRGHFYAITDNQETKRVNENTKAACITCKTPYVAKWYEEYGWDYAQMSFWELYAEIPEGEPGVSCSQCHDPATMDLRPVNPAFIDGAEALGIDLENATVDEMRTYVCAQCHNTYYMESADNAQPSKVTYPWSEGLHVDEIFTHYEKVRLEDGGFQQDWVHPDSGVAVIKDRHPDFETWTYGVHGKAGVSCADCHMPFMVEDGQKYSSHWMTSPLRHVEESCTKCHDQGTDWLVDSVTTIQANTFDIQHTAGLKIAEAHSAIASAATVEGVNENTLDDAREVLRKAQMYWDYVAAESSMGFHAADYAIRNAALALQWAEETKDLAYSAAGLQLPAYADALPLPEAEPGVIRARAEYSRAAEEERKAQLYATPEAE